MGLAEGLPTFGEEALALQVLVAFRALEALAVVVVVEGLYPAVTSLNGEATAHTLGGEQVIPVALAVGQAILQVEGTRAEDLSTVSTAETFRMELLANSIQAVSFDPLVTLSADRGEVLLIAVFTVQCALLFHEAHVNEGLAARASGAHEVVRAPCLAQR